MFVVYAKGAPNSSQRGLVQQFVKSKIKSFWDHPYRLWENSIPKESRANSSGNSKISIWPFRY